MLSGRPLLVAAVTLAFAALVTVCCYLGASGLDVVGVVSLVATVWALALAVVIYLLTAKDTDKLLARIDALQDQLSAVLEKPGEDAIVVDAAPAAKAPQVPVRPPEPMGEKLAERLPTDYLSALRHQARIDPDELRRAWTPNRGSDGPWVVEAADGSRWSVFKGRGGRPTVIPLGAVARASISREMARTRRSKDSAGRRPGSMSNPSGV